MKTPESEKRVKISHLQYCLEKLYKKCNVYNDIDIDGLYTYIHQVVLEMEEMNAKDALAYFSDKITDDIRESLLHFNIELVV